MIAEIFINGVIGGDAFNQSAEDIGTTYEDVRRQFTAFQDPTSITVYINSDGGRMSEGFAIHDFLRAQGLPVRTIGSTVFSIATVILLAGDEDKREMRPNGRFLIHNPMPAWGIQSDAKGYKNLATILEKEENDLINFYNKKTNKDKGFIRTQMDKDEPVNALTALKMGFISGIREVDNKALDVSKQPLQAKYIPSTEFLQVRDQLINQSKMAENSLVNKWKTLVKQAEKLINQAEAAPVEEPPKAEETKEETPTLEERMAAIEAMLSASKEAETVAIEARKQTESEKSDLQKTINKQDEQIKKLSSGLSEAITKIENLESQPLQPGKDEKPVPNKAANPTHAWINQSGLANKFLNEVKR